MKIFTVLIPFFLLKKEKINFKMFENTSNVMIKLINLIIIRKIILSPFIFNYSPFKFILLKLPFASCIFTKLLFPLICPLFPLDDAADPENDGELATVGGDGTGLPTKLGETARLFGLK